MPDTWNYFLIFVLLCFDADKFLDDRMKIETGFDGLSRMIC